MQEYKIKITAEADYSFTCKNTTTGVIVRAAWGDVNEHFQIPYNGLPRPGESMQIRMCPYRWRDFEKAISN